MIVNKNIETLVKHIKVDLLDGNVKIVKEVGNVMLNEDIALLNVK